MDQAHLGLAHVDFNPVQFAYLTTLILTIFLTNYIYKLIDHLNELTIDYSSCVDELILIS